MSPHLSDKTPWDDDPRVFDLLADGELGEEHRRELLTRLDDHPEGWRQCALAFLEAQAWRRELGGVTRLVDEADSEAVIHSNVGGTGAGLSVARGNVAGPPVSPYVFVPPYLRRFGTPLAMAASFLAAFVLGLAWRGRGPDAPLPGVAPDASQVAGGASALPLPPVDESFHPEPTVPEAGQTGTVTVALDGDEQTIDVPVSFASQLDPQWLREQPQAAPADLVRELLRRGHRLEQFRDVVPVQLEDGRRLLLPIDRIEVRYVGQNYQ